LVFWGIDISLGFGFWDLGFLANAHLSLSPRKPGEAESPRGVIDEITPRDFLLTN
jgi:hypothetical protein